MVNGVQFRVVIRDYPAAVGEDALIGGSSDHFGKTGVIGVFGMPLGNQTTFEPSSATGFDHRNAKDRPWARADVVAGEFVEIASARTSHRVGEVGKHRTRYA